jgi:tubulin-specific chaperone A
MFSPLRQRISEAVTKLEEQIAVAEGGDNAASSDELEKAKEMLKTGQAASSAEE